MTWRRNCARRYKPPPERSAPSSRSCKPQTPDVMRRCEIADPRVHSTCSMLLRWEAEQGQLIHSAQFSLLTGGGHIRSHVGSTNRRLVLHLSLAGSGAAIRVGAHWRQFVPGRCLGLDDSFEHEVVHAGRELRVTLVVQVLHPDLRPVRARAPGSWLRSMPRASS